jgi:hypothetical protein
LQEALEETLGADPLALLRPQTRCALLDCCKLAVALSERFFEQARMLLEKDPRAIPGWRCEEVTRRTLKVRNALELYTDLLLDSRSHRRADAGSLHWVNRCLGKGGWTGSG